MRKCCHGRPIVLMEYPLSNSGAARCRSSSLAAEEVLVAASDVTLKILFQTSRGGPRYGGSAGAGPAEASFWRSSVDREWLASAAIAALPVGTPSVSSTPLGWVRVRA